jgi:hypothetical protein
MIVAENIFVMLLVEEYFKIFMPKEHCSSQSHPKWGTKALWAYQKRGLLGVWSPSEAGAIASEGVWKSF